MRPTSVMVTLLLLLLCSPAGAAPSAEEEARAQALNDEGARHYNLAEYDDAINSFGAAYKLNPLPKHLFNLAQACRKKHLHARALDLYRTYLREAADAPNRAVVQELVKELESVVATQKAAEDRPPAGTEVALPTGMVRVEESRPWYSNAVGWSLVGGGVVALGVGTGFWVSTWSLEDSLKTGAEPDLSSIRSTISTRRAVAGILGAAGGAAIASGVIVFLVSPRTRLAPSKSIETSLGPGWIGVSGHF